MQLQPGTLPAPSQRSAFKGLMPRPQLGVLVGASPGLQWLRALIGPNTGHLKAQVTWSQGDKALSPPHTSLPHKHTAPWPIVATLVGACFSGWRGAHSKPWVCPPHTAYPTGREAAPLHSHSRYQSISCLGRGWQWRGRLQGELRTTRWRGMGYPSPLWLPSSRPWTPQVNHPPKGTQPVLP